jgi:hypothetical protein
MLNQVLHDDGGEGHGVRFIYEPGSDPVTFIGVRKSDGTILRIQDDDITGLFNLAMYDREREWWDQVASAKSFSTLRMLADSVFSILQD